MELWIWAFIGGLAGTFCMDLGARRFANIGVNDALGGLLGRWVIGFAKFKFVIDGNRELTTPESPLESRLGTMFHYIIGGGGVALIYPTWFSFSGTTLPENHILPGLIFGISSVALTWFVQYPCFGFRVCLVLFFILPKSLFGRCPDTNQSHDTINPTLHSTSPIPQLGSHSFVKATFSSSSEATRVGNVLVLLRLLSCSVMKDSNMLFTFGKFALLFAVFKR